jgi:16S rRNA (cytosine1402-N4)-methyltransferase
MSSSLLNVLPRASSSHVPVLAEEVRQLLGVGPGQTVIDATFGAGGHASLLADDLDGDGELIAIDRDPEAWGHYERFARAAAVETRFLHGAFDTVLEDLESDGVGADAILLDLGISSMQIDTPERGFSYSTDAPLDMRMDPGESESAQHLVNHASERELADIFRRYGEERYARQIARRIVQRREQAPYARTQDLVETVRSAVPAPRTVSTRSCVRAYGALERALPAAVQLLRPGGRIAVLSFHSLEDRIVKHFLRAEAKGCVCPPDFPTCVCGRQPSVRLLTKKAKRPGAGETGENPRAASARLRAAQKQD